MLCSGDAKRRSVHVQRQLSFLRDPPPPGCAPVWNDLDDDGRSEVGQALARLIAKVAGDLLGTNSPDPEEGSDE
jgi:hypothetical protein